MFSAVPSLALTQSIDVVLLVPGGEVRLGDLVNVTVHVFNQGLPTDGSDIVLRVNPSWPSSRTLNVTRVGVGLYQATMQIQYEDTNDFVGRNAIELRVDATIRSVTDSASAFLLLASARNLDVQVSASPLEASPGQSIDVTIHVTENGLPRDADNLVVFVEFLTIYPDRPPSDRLSWVHVGVGNYTATYNVPTKIRETAIAWIFASAFVATESVSGGTVLLVRVDDPFIIWYHELHVGSTNATIEVLAADRGGGPLKGATVYLNYSFSGNYADNRTANATTDDRGAARFNLSYPVWTSFVPLWGTVATASGNQPFGTSISFPSVPETVFSLRRDRPFDFFAEDETVTLNYTAYAAGQPLRFQRVSYYAYTRDFLVANGRIRTDGLGRFSLSFPSPGSHVRIDFTTEVAGIWHRDSDSVYGGNRLDVEVGPVVRGGAVRLAVTLPAVPGPWIVYFTFIPYNSASPGLRSAWTPAMPLGVLNNVLTSTGGTLEHGIVLPLFLPTDEDYLLQVHASSLAQLDPEERSYLFVVTVRLAEPSPFPTPFDLLLVVLLVALIAGAVSLFVARRRSRAEGERQPSTVTDSTEESEGEKPSAPSSPGESPRQRPKR